MVLRAFLFFICGPLPLLLSVRAMRYRLTLSPLLLLICFKRFVLISNVVLPHHCCTNLTVITKAQLALQTACC
jgi:hypothetical protein